MSLLIRGGSDPPIFGGSAILLPSRLCRDIAARPAGLPIIALAVVAVQRVDGQAQRAPVEIHRPREVGNKEHDGAYLAVREHGMSSCVIPVCGLPREGEV